MSIDRVVPDLEIVLLGTGTPMPDPERCGSGVAVRRGDRWLLVDCGRGVTQRATEARLDLSALDAVLLTHHHSDHISDLATLAIARWVGGAPTPLTVVVPSGPCSRFAERCLDAYDDQAFHSQVAAGAPVRPTVSVDDFVASPEPTLVFDSDGWTVHSALVDHHPIESAVGYRIEVGDRVVAVSGDTAVCAGIEALALGADVLIHEAVRSDRAPASLLSWNASAVSVGELARKIGVRRVVLTHLLPAPRSDADERCFVDEARASGYDGELVVARDLMRLTVCSGSPTTRHAAGAPRRPSRS